MKLSEDLKLYANRENSGIVASAAGPDFILIKFVDRRLYLYTYESTGRENVEKMKRLAMAGKGLATYINKFVRDKFAEKKYTPN